MDGLLPKPRCTTCHASYDRGVKFCPLDGGAVVDDADSTDPLIGHKIDGRYLVRRLVGRGGMGAVYEADHLGLDRRVAIKFVSDADADKELRARFRQEARAASRVVHEHVVQIYDVGLDEHDRDFIVMEYVEGRDLRHVLDDGPLEPVRAIAIVRQLLAGLHAIHEAGIVHRDIKPANILLAHGDRDFVKIMDFGIAKSLRAEVAQTDTGTGRVIGTPEYMSPEQLAGHEIDRRSDLYAVGVTLFSLVAGKMPFGNTSARLEALGGPVPSLDAARPGLPPLLIAAVERAMANAPADRFADALAFADALGDAPVTNRSTPRRASEPTAIDSPVARSRRSNATRRRPARLAIVVSALAVTCAVAIAAVVRLVHHDATPESRDAIVVRKTDAPAVDKIALARAAESRGARALAIEAYQEVLATAPTADVMYQLADLYDRIGDRARAIGFMRRYLDAAPNAADRATILDRIARLDAPPSVDAGVADASRQPPRVVPPPVSTSNNRCACRSELVGGVTQMLCKAQRKVTSCECNQITARLCPWPWTGLDDDGSPVAEGMRSGTFRCVDRTRPECQAARGYTIPNACSFVDPLKRAGTPCTGYTVSDPKTQETGEYECNSCDYGDHFGGNDGEPCQGWTPRGEAMRGTLESCRPR